MMFGLVSRRRALALEEENRRLRMKVRVYEALSTDTAGLVYRYERRLTRLCRALAATRRELAAQHRLADRLMDQVLDATGYQAAPLLPAARTALGIDKEVTP
ncbi:hypothetical protein ACGFY0_45230 [Streptomyces chartreusis]|uniref:hypothetical protein n=1 Tax=Streptomyces chartreusis TaxID=1969 RepID=UPI0037140084